LRIVSHCQQAKGLLAGHIEVDESYEAARRVKGKRGRGARGKTIVFGLLKREGKIYTQIVPDCSASTLQRIILGKADINSVIHSDG
jgi:transposase-like protein